MEQRQYCDNDLLTRKEAARVLGISEDALRKREKRRGETPPGKNEKGLIRYVYSELIAPFRRKSGAA
jgi:hypothetical protein